MYQIQAADSMEAIQAIKPVEPDSVPMPSISMWLDPAHISLIAVGPDGPVGGALLTPCRYVANTVVKYRLEWLYVRPEHRHRGLGHRLAQAAAAEANRRGASTILISVRPSNDSGLSWAETLPKVSGLGFVLSLDRCGL